MDSELRTQKFPEKIVIVGAGVQGAALAFYLTKFGHKQVTIIEKSNRVAPGASGEGSGLLARNWGSGPTIQLHEQSFQLHSELAREIHLKSYETIPILSVSSTSTCPYPKVESSSSDSTSKFSSYSSSLASASPSSSSSSSSCSSPSFASSRNTPCSWIDDKIKSISMLDSFQNCAHVNPLELCTKLIAKSILNGANIILGCAVEGIETKETITSKQSKEEEEIDLELNNENDSRLFNKEVSAVLLSNSGCIEADAVVVTMGPWASKAEEWFGVSLPIGGLKTTSVVFDLDQPIDKPCYIYCSEDPIFGTCLEIDPQSDPLEVVVSGLRGTEYVSSREVQNGKYSRAEDCLPDATRVIAGCQAFAKICPHIGSKAPLRTDASMRPCSPDGLPLMGKINHLKGAYISAGHNCWGILWAPSSGKAMAELILFNESQSIDLKPFSPNRFTQHKLKKSPSWSTNGHDKKMEDLFDYLHCQNISKSIS